MQNLRYVGKNLFIEKLSIKNILKKNKTPFYIYSENQIIFNFLKFANTFKKTNPLVCFAAKSNSNLDILKTLKITESEKTPYSLHPSLKAGWNRVVKISIPV